MATRLLPSDVEAEIHRALLATWSERTQPAFCRSTPSYNQCAQTAIAIYDTFGGEILRTKITMCTGELIDHFYNRIDGHRYDFTDGQFELSDFRKPIVYLDTLSSRHEAEATLQPSQVFAMTNGFRAAYRPPDVG
jgi:hypothetical protein